MVFVLLSLHVKREKENKRRSDLRIKEKKSFSQIARMLSAGGGGSINLIGAECFS